MQVLYCFPNIELIDLWRHNLQKIKKMLEVYGSNHIFNKVHKVVVEVNGKWWQLFHWFSLSR